MSEITKIDSNPDSPYGQIHSNEFKVNSKPDTRLWIVDNFYEDPDAVRAYALKTILF